MKLEQMRDEALLSLAERRHWADNLEDTIRRGHLRAVEVDAALAKVKLLRSRLPDKQAIVSAFTLLIEGRERLPRELVERLEADA